MVGSASSAEADSVDETCCSAVCCGALLGLDFCNFLPRGFAAGFDFSGAVAVLVDDTAEAKPFLTALLAAAIKLAPGEPDRECDLVMRRRRAAGGEVDLDSGAAADSESLSDCEVAVGGEGFLAAASFLSLAATTFF